MAFNFWRGIPTKLKRILTIAAFFLLSLIITIAGVLTPLTPSEADSLEKELKEIRENVSVQYIFGNNFMLCLAFFIPFVGPILGCYALYNTGVFIAADSITAKAHPLMSFFFLFIFPSTWLEFLSYSTAFAQSMWLSWRIIQRRGRKELVNTCILISLCAIMLLIAAIIEVAIFQALSPAS